LIAALDAYDWPEVRSEIDRFWHALAKLLREQGIDAPVGLERGPALRLFWQREDVLIGQTCSRPYRLGQHRRFAVIGSLYFAVPECESGLYCSRVIARPGLHLDSIRHSDRLRLAVNSLCSQSGWAALEHWMTGQGIEPGIVTLTGSHRTSIVGVAGGSADLAAIDAVSWYLAERFERAARDVVVLGSTPSTPGLPLVTSRRNTPLLPNLRDAVSHAARSAKGRRCADLPIIGFAPAADRLYRLDPHRQL
jgi:ABC-type phosphate/phosphonate transport system substrate-binding protein